VFTPRWYITVVHQNEEEDDIILGSSGSTEKSWEWNKAQKYKVILQLLVLT
jgi:hypothetical protein